MAAALLLLCFSPAALGSRIFEAVDANDPTAVRAALADGADINEISATGQTPIMRAADTDKLRAAAALMKMGADATIPDGYSSYTPLHTAAAHGHAKIVGLLLRYKVEANMMHEADGLTPFHRACQGSEPRHTDTVFTFLDAGTPPDQPSRDHKRPIDMSGSENTRHLLQEALREKRRR